MTYFSFIRTPFENNFKFFECYTDIERKIEFFFKKVPNAWEQLDQLVIMTNCENEEFFKKCLDILSQIKYFVTTEKELQLLEKLKEIVESKQLHEELNEDYKKNAERIIIDLNEIFNNEYNFNYDG